MYMSVHPAVARKSPVYAVITINKGRSMTLIASIGMLSASAMTTKIINIIISARNGLPAMFIIPVSVSPIHPVVGIVMLMCSSQIDKLGLI